MKEAISRARSLIRSTAAMGGSSAVTTLASIGKTKVVAVVLGPSGVGAIGILGSFTAVIATFAGMGLSSAAVRPITGARKRDDRQRLRSLRAGLTLFAVSLGAVGGGMVIGFRGQLYGLADLSLGGALDRWAAVALGIAVLASAWLETKKAWIIGSERPLDWARTTALAGVMAAGVSVAAVLWLAEAAAVVCLVIALPLCSLAVASWLAREPSLSEVARPSLRSVGEGLAPIVRLGGALMVTSLMVVATLFAAQWIIKSQSGMESVGQFQASWTLSATAMGFLLGALWIDYSPRLAGVADDRRALAAMMNEQLYLSLLLAAPLLLWLSALAPLVVRLLYSPVFLPATAVLRWQAVGDLVRVVEAVLGFVLVIQSRSRLFFVKELVGNAIFLFVLWAGLGRFGLPVAGAGFLLGQGFRVIFIGWALRREIGFAWDRTNQALMLAVAGCSAVLLAAAQLGGARWPWAIALAALSGLTVVCYFKLRRALGAPLGLTPAGQP